jgi:nicotinate-nucleotide pyrophosphorylase
MKSVKSLDSEDKFVLVIDSKGGECKSRDRLVANLKERYGDNLEVFSMEEFDKINGLQADYMILDELNSLERQTKLKSYKTKPQESPYWQRGRWFGQ